MKAEEKNIDYNNAYHFNDKEIYGAAWSSSNPKVIYGCLESKFNIGDKVKIKGRNHHYDRYKAMLFAMNFSVHEWKQDKIEYETTGVIAAMRLHECLDQVLYGVRLPECGNKIIIVGEIYLELIRRADMFREFDIKDFKI